MPDIWYHLYSSTSSLFSRSALSMVKLVVVLAEIANKLIKLLKHNRGEFFVFMESPWQTIHYAAVQYIYFPLNLEMAANFTTPITPIIWIHTTWGIFIAIWWYPRLVVERLWLFEMTYGGRVNGNSMVMRLLTILAGGTLGYRWEGAKLFVSYYVIDIVYSQTESL